MIYGYKKMIEECFPDQPPDKILAIERFLLKCQPFLRGESDSLSELLATWERYQPQYINVVFADEAEFRAISVMVKE